MNRAQSRYKQVRVTLTEQADVQHPGRVMVSVRVHVKPLNADWQEKQLVLTAETRDLAPITDLDDVYAAILETLAAPPLPGHIG